MARCGDHVLASYLHVRGVAAQVGVQWPRTVATGEALLVVDIVHADHLLSWEHLVMGVMLVNDKIFLCLTTPAHRGQAFSPSLPPIV